jgi:hypothetical protein
MLLADNKIYGMDNGQLSNNGSESSVSIKGEEFRD